MNACVLTQGMIAFLMLYVCVSVCVCVTYDLILIPMHDCFPKLSVVYFLRLHRVLSEVW